MDTNALIPYSEFLPAPAWLLILLEQLLFLLHIVVINAVLGGFLILLFRKLRDNKYSLGDDLHQSIAYKLPAMIALGVNFAIPPLLFMQVVFGSLFYTSSIMMAVYWILIIPLLILGYYMAYIHRSKMLQSPGFSKLMLSAAILILLYVGFVLVSNNSLMEQPGLWEAYFDNRGGTLVALGLSSLIPRYLHFIMASIAIGGLFYATLAKFSKTAENKDEKVKYSLQIFAIATSVQVVTGFWYLFTIPQNILPQFMGQNMLVTIILMLGILGGISAIIFGFLNKYTASVISVLATLVFMILNRLNLRLLHLGDYFVLDDLQMKPQYGVLALFIVLLLIGVASIIYMLKISSNKSKS